MNPPGLSGITRIAMPLPFDLTPATAAFMALAFLVAAFVRGYSGFGFSALVVASSALVTNPLYFVAVVMFCEFGMTLQQWSGIWRDVAWRRVIALMIGAILGLPLGLWALTGIGADAARAVVSIYVLFMCAVMLMGWRITRPQGDAGHLVVGVVSGLANAPGMGGLPVALARPETTPTTRCPASPWGRVIRQPINMTAHMNST